MVVVITEVFMNKNIQENIKNELMESIKDFKLPRYNEIPGVGLYLEQVTKYIGEYIEPLGMSITSSMISNYVKKDLVANPVKKQYNREQIAYLMFIAMAKSVLSLEDLKLFIGVQKASYESEIAYNYFSREMEKILQTVFAQGDYVDGDEQSFTLEKNMLRNTAVAISHKVYLEKFFGIIGNKVNL